MNARREVTPEYIYTTIPAEYVCVYHKILAMLADYGEEMLKDCKELPAIKRYIELGIIF